MNTEANKLLLAAKDVDSSLKTITENYKIQGSEIAVIEVLKATYEASRQSGLSTDA
ncbi:hypothetical protein [Providencia sp. PROV172]|uniref:hypothetical protein n=1 Tax=Providencia sp. PROV172 TaxID=2949876 RepID=UPI0023493F80|nr:hypothetical protein [Providencia sp. PROV172]